MDNFYIDCGLLAILCENKLLCYGYYSVDAPQANLNEHLSTLAVYFGHQIVIDWLHQNNRFSLAYHIVMKLAIISGQFKMFSQLIVHPSYSLEQHSEYISLAFRYDQCCIVEWYYHNYKGLVKKLADDISYNSPACMKFLIDQGEITEIALLLEEALTMINSDDFLSKYKDKYIDSILILIDKINIQHVDNKIVSLLILLWKHNRIKAALKKLLSAGLSIDLFTDLSSKYDEDKDLISILTILGQYGYGNQEIIISYLDYLANVEYGDYDFDTVIGNITIMLELLLASKCSYNAEEFYSIIAKIDSVLRSSLILIFLSTGMPPSLNNYLELSTDVTSMSILLSHAQRYLNYENQKLLLTELTKKPFITESPLHQRILKYHYPQ